jgi:hypothetical protein
MWAMKRFGAAPCQWFSPRATRRSADAAPCASMRQRSPRVRSRSPLVLSEHVGAAGEKRRIHAEARVWCDAAEAAPDCRFQRRACSQSKRG